MTRVELRGEQPSSRESVGAGAVVKVVKVVQKKRVCRSGAVMSPSPRGERANDRARNTEAQKNQQTLS
jgi:hypothetical protein